MLILRNIFSINKPELTINKNHTILNKCILDLLNKTIKPNAHNNKNQRILNKSILDLPSKITFHKEIINFFRLILIKRAIPD